MIYDKSNLSFQTLLRSLYLSLILKHSDTKRDRREKHTVDHSLDGLRTCCAPTWGPLHKTFTGEKTRVTSENSGKHEFTIDFSICNRPLDAPLTGPSQSNIYLHLWTGASIHFSDWGGGGKSKEISHFWARSARKVAI